MTFVDHASQSDVVRVQVDAKRLWWAEIRSASMLKMAERQGTRQDEEPEVEGMDLLINRVDI